MASSPATHHRALTTRDIVCAAINGMIFGAGASVIVNNSVSSIPHIPGVITTLIFGVAGIIAIVVGAVLARYHHIFFQLAKFALVGVANTAIDLGVFNALIYAVGGSTTVLIGAVLKGISFFVAVLNSYIWNRSWSFEKTSTADGSEFAKFVSVSVAGLLLNSAVTAGISAILAHGGVVSGQAATVAAAIASIVVLAWNFLGYKLFVFKV